jgi:hypothetical protein
MMQITDAQRRVITIAAKPFESGRVDATASTARKLLLLGLVHVDTLGNYHLTRAGWRTAGKPPASSAVLESP